MKFLTRHRCPGCGSVHLGKFFSVPFAHTILRRLLGEDRFALLRESLSETTFALSECRDCTLIFQDNVLNQHEALVFYDRSSQSTGQAPNLTFAARAHLAQEVILLRLLVGEAVTPNVLDFGMGWGNWSEMARAFGCCVQGVEVNAHAVAAAQAKGLSVVRLDDVGDETVDAVFSNQVFEHLDQPLQVAGQLARKLKPNGFFYVSVPRNTQLVRKLRRSDRPSNTIVDQLNERDWDTIFPLEHVNLFSNTALRIMMASHGLRVHCPPFRRALASAVLWNTPRQWSRNLTYPIKFRKRTATSLWFVKSSG